MICRMQCTLYPIETHTLQHQGSHLPNDIDNVYYIIEMASSPTHVHAYLSVADSCLFRSVDSAPVGEPFYQHLSGAGKPARATKSYHVVCNKLLW